MTRITATLPGVFMDTELFSDGWQLQSVEGWWGATDPRLDNEARELGHGDFGQAEAFQDARFVTLSGVFQCRADPDAILAADGVLTALLNREEFPLSIAYGSRSGTVMARMASRVSWDPDHAPGAAQFEVTFKADDPRIYGVTQTASTGVPTAGAGVADPLLDPFQVGTLAEVGRNLFTNPNLVGDGTWAEVRRNLCGNPVGALDRSGWGAVTREAGAAPFSSSFLRYAAPSSGSTTSYAFPTVIGSAYTLSLFMRNTSTAARVDLRDSAGVVAAGSSNVVRPDWQRVSVAGIARQASSFITVRADGAGDIDFVAVLAEQSPTVNPYFDGSSPTGSIDPDMRQRWLGTPNASESVMEIGRVAGLTATNCVAGVSTRAGKPAARLIPTSSLTTSFASFPISPAAQASGTVVATSHLDAPLPSPLDRRRGSVDTSSPQADGPIRDNTAGAAALRQIFSAQSTYASARIWHGGVQGSGDVWWADIGLFAGDYAGPAVSGDSPPSGDLVYVWAGQRNNSETTIYQVDASAEGNLGRVAIVNGGNAPTEPTVTVTGGLSGGFELLCIETGRVVRVTRPIPDGSQISIAMGSGEIWIDGQSPVPAQFAPVTEWMQVQPGQTCTIQFTPLGVVSGTPTMTVEWAEASW